MATGTYQDFVMAMERVEQRLHRVTAALDAAGIRYAVIGGNAVAAWVARIDPGATRTTKDVELLVERADIDRISAVMSGLGFRREDLRSLTLFVDESEPNRKTGVHVVWAGEKVRPFYAHAAPTLNEVQRDPAGFQVLSLAALVRMKLTSFRDLDRVHVADVLRAGLIEDSLRAALPEDLRARHATIEASMDPDADEWN